jgi:peptidyl-prolyl cis-trans isomerase A (cyclophilin A)
LFALGLIAQTQSTTKPGATKSPTKPAATTKKPAAATATTVSQYPKAIFNTTAGQITCTLYPDKAPITVDNFIGLATGTKEWTNPSSGAKMRGVPYFNGTVFHRVIPDFMIQGGDPLGNGAGGPGYKFRNEYSELQFDKPGRLAMANAGVDTNGSQFFITVTSKHLYQLDGRYTIFGQCGNLDVANKIAAAPKTMTMSGENSKPLDPVKITKLTIVKAGQATPSTVPKPGTKPAPKPATKTAPKPGTTK